MDSLTSVTDFQAALRYNSFSDLVGVYSSLIVSVVGLTLFVLPFQPYLGIFVFVCGLLGMAILLFLAPLLDRRSLWIDPNGMSISSIGSGPLRFGVLRWDDLDEVRFLRGGVPVTGPEVIAFQLKNGKKKEFKIDGFSKQDLERLLLAINLFAPKVRWNPALDKLNLRLNLEKRLQGLSFTELWDRDLECRFGSTVFIPLECGDRLQNGKIEVVGQMAYGGLSAIYLVRMDGKRTCVLKEAVLPLRCEGAVREKALDLFQRETQLLARIDHPRIVEVYDYFVENDRHYMLMELVQGVNLRRYIMERGPQGQNVIIDWAREMGSIVEFLHTMEPPVIHRDLSPDNFLIGEDEKITLVDFGAANLFLGTVTGTVIGKMSYMPPEQFRGKATLKSDIYALGCTLHFILTGRDPEPFQQCDPAYMGVKISPDFNDLIRRCTVAERPDYRPDAQEFNKIMKSVGPLPGVKL